MEQFLVYGRDQPSLPRGTLRRLNIEQIAIKCGDSVTSFIKKMADETETSVALAHLEGNHIPVELLPSWLARLGTLSSLRLRDGSVLDVAAASAVAECCPNFRDLTLFYLEGPAVDEDMASFFQTLRPHSLRNFQIMSRNRIGERTLTALNAHSKTLKSLKLGSLSAQGMKSLNVLPSCTALEVLEIENGDYGYPVDLKAFSEGMLKEVAAWIGGCKSLRDITFKGVKDALLIVKDVLNSPGIRLKSLDIQFFGQYDGEGGTAAWAALGLQEDLESFTLGAQLGALDVFNVGDNPPLVDSICRLKNLKSLNLKQVYTKAADVHQIAGALPQLEDFSFGGEGMEDSILISLARLPSLTILQVNAQSTFTWDGLREFAESLDPVRHRGFQCDVFNQLAEARITDEQQAWLQRFYSNNLDGRFDILHFRDPDELHESDFSDSD
jgi:hypothetical protein